MRPNSSSTSVRVTSLDPARSAAHVAARLLPAVLTGFHDADRTLLHRQLAERAGELHEVSSRVLQATGSVPGIGRTLDDVCRDLDETAELVSQLADAVLLPFMLFVVGMGKFGKSTLVNALLGLRMADMDALPKTWKIDVFTARGESDRVLIKTRDGERIERSVADARRLLAEEERKREDSEDEIDAVYRDKVRGLTTVEQKEELRSYLRKELLYESSISEVHWRCKASRLLDRFNVIDTPGLFQQLLAEHAKVDLRDYYHKADGVLWLLDATKLASAMPAKLMEDLEEALAEVGGRTDNIIAVLNRMDLAAPDPAARKRLVDEANRVFPDRFLSIVPFSAKRALDAIERNDAQGLEESGYLRLMESIERHFVARAVRLQKRSKALGLRGYVHDLAARSETYADRLSRACLRRADLITGLDRALEDFESRVRTRRDTLAERYGADVRLRIEHRTQGLLELDTEAERAAFLRDSIFESSRLESWVGEVMEMIDREATYVFDAQRGHSLFKEFEHLDVETLPKRDRSGTHVQQPVVDINFDVRIDQALIGGAGALVASLLLAPQAALFGLLAFTDVGKWAARKVRAFVMRPKLERELGELLYRIRSDLDLQLRTVRAEIHGRVSTLRDESFQSVYCSPHRASAVLTELRRVREIGDRPFTSPRLAEVIAGRYRRAG